MQAVEASEVDVVITPKIDRLGRNARHNLALFETFGLPQTLPRPERLPG